MAVTADQILLVLVLIIFSTMIVLERGHVEESTCTDSATCNENQANQPTQHNSDDTNPSFPYKLCIDHDESCPKWADLGYCQKNHTDMLRECPISCDSCEDREWNAQSPGCPHKYPACEDCQDKLKECKYWKNAGECLRHPGYMVINCARTCKYCHLQSNYALRCPMNEEYMRQTRVLPKPGDLNQMFENIVSHYNMHKNQTEDDGVIEWDLEILSHDPWILRFDNFFTEDEANGIIEAAGKFERSTDVGQKDETGHFAKVTSTSRTSKNAWCHERCWNHPMVQKVMTRVENLLNISNDNSEHLQILEYKKGQYYKTHHDYIPNQLKMSCGPRILTWFMYLSDVEEGGGTYFPRLKLLNPPKLGRVVFWPSVLDTDASVIDRRTYHEAQAVVKGVKYGANAWYHLYNFQEPNLWTCTG
eukprot:45293_1